MTAHGAPGAGRRVDVLGVGIDPIDRAGLFGAVASLVAGGAGASGAGATIAYANVHVILEAGRDTALREFLHAATLVYCDGAGVGLGARILGGHLPERMTGADWIWELAERAERAGWRLFWMGGEPGVAAEAARRLIAHCPGLQIRTEHGFVSDATAAIYTINAYQPHIVLVGMGTPVQERWVAAHRRALHAPVVWVTGATADFVSGRVERGPAWLHQRQEWLARLLVDPRRLWRRYLVGNSVFLTRVVGQRIRGRAAGAGRRTD